MATAVAAVAVAAAIVAAAAAAAAVRTGCSRQVAARSQPRPSAVGSAPVCATLRSGACPRSSPDAGSHAEPPASGRLSPARCR